MSARRKTVTLKFSAEDLARFEKVAAKSDRSVEDWMWSAVFVACLTDEAHWQEMEERAAIRSTIERARYAKLSHQLANLTDATFDVLADLLVDERIKGRGEGVESAGRLTAVRGAR